MKRWSSNCGDELRIFPLRHGPEVAAIGEDSTDGDDMWLTAMQCREVAAELTRIAERVATLRAVLAAQLRLRHLMSPRFIFADLCRLTIAHIKASEPVAVNWTETPILVMFRAAPNRVTMMSLMAMCDPGEEPLVVVRDDDFPDWTQVRVSRAEGSPLSDTERERIVGLVRGAS